MRKLDARFEELPVQLSFSKNGINFFKRSTRTAEIENGPHTGIWFYFDKKDSIEVDEETADHALLLMTRLYGNDEIGEGW